MSIYLISYFSELFKVDQCRKCIGIDSGTKQRCLSSLIEADFLTARDLLNRMNKADLLSFEIDMQLKRLASLLLCPMCQNHAKSMVHKWQERLRDYRLEIAIQLLNHALSGQDSSPPAQMALQQWVPGLYQFRASSAPPTRPDQDCKRSALTDAHQSQRGKAVTLPRRSNSPIAENNESNPKQVLFPRQDISFAVRDTDPTQEQPVPGFSSLTLNTANKKAT
ncbi:MAG: hypothetical protein Q9167_003461 [Letrouitia subvulpina]